jgi:hypothetical protein
VLVVGPASAAAAAPRPGSGAPARPRAVVGTEWIQACADAGVLLPTPEFERAAAAAAAAAAEAAAADAGAASVGDGPLGHYKCALPEGLRGAWDWVCAASRLGQRRPIDSPGAPACALSLPLPPRKWLGHWDESLAQATDALEVMLHVSGPGLRPGQSARGRLQAAGLGGRAGAAPLGVVWGGGLQDISPPKIAPCLAPPAAPLGVVWGGGLQDISPPKIARCLAPPAPPPRQADYSVPAYPANAPLAAALKELAGYEKAVWEPRVEGADARVGTSVGWGLCVYVSWGGGVVSRAPASRSRCSSG